MTFGHELKEQFVNVTQQIDVLRQQIQSSAQNQGNRGRTSSKDRPDLTSLAYPNTPQLTARSVPNTARLTSRSTLHSLHHRSGDLHDSPSMNNQSSPARVSMLRKRAGSGSFISPAADIHSSSSPGLGRANPSPATRLSMRSGTGSATSSPTGAALAARRRLGSSPSPSSSPARLTRKRFEK